MSLAGRRPHLMPRPPARRPVQFYVRWETHDLIRAAAEARGQTIGSLVDELVAAEAARLGLHSGQAAS